MTLAQLFDVFHDRASVVSPSNSFKTQKAGQIPIGKDTSTMYTGNFLILGEATSR